MSYKIIVRMNVMQRLSKQSLIIVLIGFLTISCAKSRFNQANFLYKNKNYEKAITKYESLSDADKQKFGVAKTLAGAYYYSRDYDQAQLWYVKAIKADTNDSYLLYQMALCMKLNDNCSEGLGYLEKFKAMEIQKGNDVTVGSGFCNPSTNTVDLFDTKKLKIARGTTFLNPIVYNDRLYFLSQLDGNKNYQICSVKENDQSDFKVLNGTFNEAYSIGSFTFDETDNRLYFTRKKIVKDEVITNQESLVHLEIVKAKYNGTTWEIEKSFEHNQENFSVGHPTISPDGKWMVFTSDKKESLGETDLFICKKSNKGTWGKPRQLPIHVNSTDKELTPCIVKNLEGTGYLLNFASNRPSSIGGMDVFSVPFDGTTWGDIIHHDYPVNSSFNEYSLYYDEQKNESKLVSDRATDYQANEVYQFGVVNRVMGTLRSVNNTPIANEELLITNMQTQETETTTTDRNGKYTINLKQGAVYNITPKSDKYERKLMSLTSDKKMSPEIYDLDLKVDFATNKPSLPVTFVMKELYFELNEAYIYEKSSTDLNKLHAKLAKNQDINITVIGHTDSRGPAEYNLTLSQKRANAVVEWLIYQGIDRRRLTAVGKGESELVNDCEDGVSCSAKEHKDNRRTTFTINKRDRR